MSYTPLGAPHTLTPHIRPDSWSDEEPVDQKKILEDRCKGTCVKQFRAYEACVDRIKGDDTGTKHCTGQYFDYYYCIDRCVAPKLFKKLK
ncbi:reductase [Lithospermum erythrorhizon]|uniref:Complex III subunit VI n=1 Tax=Lithospermum erythrorhizon TaxID=34254 RepID=A0AAV3S0D7_LITER